MRVPVDWLREYVAVPADATGVQIAADLVRVGLEEEGLHGGGVTGPLVVGRVLSKEPEPQKNGKTINWCSLDVGEANGTGEPQWVVCGAHNFEVGDLVAVILPGGVLPTSQGPLTVSARKTYGHVSAGMICSERELGLGDDHDGIIVLTRRFAGDEEQLARLVPGADAIPILGLDRETVEVNVKGYFHTTKAVVKHLMDRNAPGAIVNLGKRESVLSTDDSSRVGLSQSRIVHQVYVALDRCRHGLSGQEGASFNSHVPAQDRCNFR